MDSVDTCGLGDKVGVWRCQTSAWGRRNAFAPRNWWLTCVEIFAKPDTKWDKPVGVCRRQTPTACLQPKKSTHVRELVEGVRFSTKSKNEHPPLYSILRRSRQRAIGRIFARNPGSYPVFVQIAKNPLPKRHGGAYVREHSGNQRNGCTWKDILSISASRMSEASSRQRIVLRSTICIEVSPYFAWL